MATIRGTSKRDVLRDASAANTILGLAGNDDLYGNGGNDTLKGGLGNDKLFGGAGNDKLFGEARNDTLDGGTGNDTLDGGLGTDTMKGGLGNDTYVVGSSTDKTIDTGGNDLVKASVSWTLGTGFEKLLLTGAGAVNGTGNALGNLITGNNGANILDGGAGDDTMSGGAGNDTFIVDSLLDVVIDTSGTDTVRSSVTYTLGPTIENLVLLGTAADGTGNALANTITGNDGVNVLAGSTGDDVLIGGAGGDSLDGGGDSDFASYETSVGAVLAALDASLIDASFLLAFGNVSGDAIGDTYADIESLRGTNTTSAVTFQDQITFQDFLIGNSAANILEGLDGNDVLMGGFASDSLRGGAGIDIACYLGLSGVIANLTNPATSNTGDAAGDTYSSIEGIIGSVGIDWLVGDAGDNWLWGGNGTDTLDGGDGNDVLTADYAFGYSSGRTSNTLNGGDGSDTANYSWALYINRTVDLFNGTAVHDAGTDTLTSIENVIFSIAGMKVIASAAANRFDGGAGTDTVSYEFSDAGVAVNLFASSAAGGFAAGDTLVSIESLIGSAHADQLTGNGGSNVLTGRGGADTLDGGAAADTFRYLSTSDSGLNAARDVIQSFDAGADLIDLSAIGGLTFIGTAAFSGDGLNEVRFDTTSAPGLTIIQIDTINGDASHNMEIELSGTIALTGSNFAL